MIDCMMCLTENSACATDLKLIFFFVNNVTFCTCLVFTVHVSCVFCVVLIIKCAMCVHIQLLLFSSRPV